MLTTKFNDDEIQLALKGMGPMKALGDESFLALFFQKFCYIIGLEVTSFCLQILNENFDIELLNITNIVLIPKIQNPSNMVNFRPISLCCVLYKLIAKTIANRFQHVLENCIDSAQSTFVPVRLISDNILVTYEVMHMLR